MDTITKKDCQTIRDALNTALEAVGKDLGLSLDVGRMSYTSTSVSIKLTAAVIAADGVVMTEEARNVKEWAFHHGCGEDALGKTFMQRGRTFRITGYKPRSPKWPWLATAVDDGRSYKFQDSAVKRALGVTAQG